jgi:hypothetical protein
MHSGTIPIKEKLAASIKITDAFNQIIPLLEICFVYRLNPGK